MAEDKKAVVQQWFDNFMAGDMEAQRALTGEGHQFHFPLNPGPVGVDEHLGAQAAFKAAIPDLVFTIHDQTVEGDIVTTRWTFTGTHQNDLMGIPASGAGVSVDGINMMKVVDGKNVEEWDAFDTLGFMTQVGVVPPMGG